MSKIKYIFLLFLFKLIISAQICVEGQNLCAKCDYRTKLCSKCERDNLIPDEYGGCEGAKQCKIGKNYCLNCDEEEHLCKKCEEGYTPDENGGCSNTNNCEISEFGKCIKCKSDFILIGDSNQNFNWCKSLNSEDLKNCEKIDQKTGLCQKCEENYFLNKGDHKCIDIENCYQSTFGICIKCIDRYYYNKLENECKMQTGMFYKCKQSINNKTCDICDDNYYLAENEKCTEVNYCAKSVDYGRCEECVSGYNLIGSGYNSNCTITENCLIADRDTGLCLECIKGYYIDYKDGKCKSNQKDDEFKFCKIVDDSCISCENGYFLGEDSKCSNTQGCIDSENGICNECSDAYYYGSDKKCSLIPHCIYSKNENECIECEDNYCYNQRSKQCFYAQDIFKNCKLANEILTHCFICKSDFYLNQTDNLCYSNQEKGAFYKCEITNYNAKNCFRCIDGYYLGDKYNRCSKIDGCEYSEDDKKCIECDFDYYCLDVNTGKCIRSDEIKDKDKKFYFKCNRTNEEGTACEICLDGFTLDENGLCIDKNSCKEEDEDGKCIKCPSNEEDRVFHYHCLNSIFGCVETFLENCLECEDILDFEKCTKCVDGYKIDKKANECVEIEQK
jgi:hypothetical protein